MSQEQVLVNALYIIFGISMLAWVPRFPELKANLGLSNAAFGSILTSGAIGAFVGLLICGQLVQKHGVKLVGVLSSIILFSSMILIVHIHTPAYFLFLNILVGFGITALHVVVNTQAFDLQERSGRHALTEAAGYWSVGVLSTAILSGLLIGRVGLSLHVGALCAISLLLNLWIFYYMTPVLAPANTSGEVTYRVRDVFRSFHLDWPISLGMACAVYIEMAAGDWSTILTKERFGISAGLSALTYITFTIAMIIGRLSISKIDQKYSIYSFARVATVIAGSGFILFLSIASHLPADKNMLAFVLVNIAFAFAGLGTSLLGPNFTRAANRRSPHPSSVVIGQLGVANNVLTTAAKWLVAGVIGATGSIAVGMMIPGLMLIATSFFAYVLKED